MSPIGGTLAVEVGLVAMDDGTLAVGPRLEVAARDRVVLEGSVHMALSPRWNAVRFGSVSFLRAEAHGGLRQRVGRGPWAVRMDAWAGLGWLETLEAPPRNPLDYRVTHRPVPVAGGTVRVRNIGFEMGFGLGPTGQLAGRAGVMLRLPGVVAVW